MALTIVVGAAAVAVHLWLIRAAILGARRWLISPVVIGVAVILVLALHGAGLRQLVRRLRPHPHGHQHSHDTGDRIDSALTASAEGMRALRISLVVLGATAVAQFVVVLASGSVALLSDTIHNFADALTAIPIGIAFLAGRRLPNRRYTYGYGRGEDVAGLFVLLAMALSALIAAYRIRVGRRIGSAALLADGLHARTDGLTSLAVVAGAVGVAAGWRSADPVAGLAIGIAIIGVLRQAVREIYGRMMDRVDDHTVLHAEEVIRQVPGVVSLDRLRMRWVGHDLLAEVEIAADASLSLPQAHDLAEAVRHQLLHQVPRLADATVHVGHQPTLGGDAHRETSHHFSQRH